MANGVPMASEYNLKATLVLSGPDLRRLGVANGAIGIASRDMAIHAALSGGVYQRLEPRSVNPMPCSNFKFDSCSRATLVLPIPSDQIQPLGGKKVAIGRDLHLSVLKSDVRVSSCGNMPDVVSGHACETVDNLLSAFSKDGAGVACVPLRFGRMAHMGNDLTVISAGIHAADGSICTVHRKEQIAASMGERVDALQTFIEKSTAIEQAISEYDEQSRLSRCVYMACDAPVESIVHGISKPLRHVPDMMGAWQVDRSMIQCITSSTGGKPTPTSISQCWNAGSSIPMSRTCEQADIGMFENVSSHGLDQFMGAMLRLSANATDADKYTAFMSDCTEDALGFAQKHQQLVFDALTLSVPGMTMAYQADAVITQGPGFNLCSHEFERFGTMFKGVNPTVDHMHVGDDCDTSASALLGILKTIGACNYASNSNRDITGHKHLERIADATRFHVAGMMLLGASAGRADAAQCPYGASHVKAEQQCNAGHASAVAIPVSHFCDAVQRGSVNNHATHFAESPEADPLPPRGTVHASSGELLKTHSHDNIRGYAALKTADKVKLWNGGNTLKCFPLEGTSLSDTAAFNQAVSDADERVRARIGDIHCVASKRLPLYRMDAQGRHYSDFHKLPLELLVGGWCADAELAPMSAAHGHYVFVKEGRSSATDRPHKYFAGIDVHNMMSGDYQLHPIAPVSAEAQAILCQHHAEVTARLPGCARDTPFRISAENEASYERNKERLTRLDQQFESKRPRPDGADTAVLHLGSLALSRRPHAVTALCERLQNVCTHVKVHVEPFGHFAIGASGQPCAYAATIIAQIENTGSCSSLWCQSFE